MKIQQSIKMQSLKHKMRRPSGNESEDVNDNSSLNESATNQQPTIPEEESASPVLSKPKGTRSGSVKKDTVPPAASKVHFASARDRRGSCDSDVIVEGPEVVEQQDTKSDSAFSGAAVTSTAAVTQEEPVQVEPPKKVRGTRKGKKVETEEVAVVEKKEEQVETASQRARKTRKTPETDAPVDGAGPDEESAKEAAPLLPSRKTKKTEETDTLDSLRKRSKESINAEDDVIGLPVVQSVEVVEKKEKACPASRKGKINQEKNQQAASRKDSVESVVASVVESDKPKVETEDDAATKRATRTRQVKKTVESDKPVAISPRQTRQPKAPEPPTSARKDRASKISHFVSPASSPARKPFLVFRYATSKSDCDGLVHKRSNSNLFFFQSL